MLEALCDGIFRIVIPFEDIYTTVFVLVEGGKAAILDSACSDADMETYVIPETRALGADVAYLVTTHSHADHAGGRARLMCEYPTAVCVDFFSGGAWQDGDVLLGRFRLLSMKGHISDGLAVYDERTKTLISGDCLQQHGISHYRNGISDGAAYRCDIARVRSMDIEILIASHDYDFCGFLAKGRAQIEAVLCDCEEAMRVMV